MEAQSVHSSQADVWYLKEIVFGAGDARRPVKIITQNFNGPCSFIAICNILILRGQIEILPKDRTTASYEFLSQLVGEYLLINCPDIDISAALSIMPSTTKGLDLNPKFTSITAFSPASDMGELDLFAQAGIQLVHGWVVDPESPEAGVMEHIRDYDTAVTLIADADYITRGRLLGGNGDGNGDENGDGRGDGRAGYGEAEAGPSSGAVAGSSSGASAGGVFACHNTSQYSDEDRRKIEQAIVAQQFLDATKSQLTYHGLFQLASTLEPGSLVALFRNAHLSVIYKSPGGGLGLVQDTTTPYPTPYPVPEPSTDADINANINAEGHAPAPETNSNTNSNGADDTTTTNPTHPHPTSQDPALYALVTDDVFLHEPSIVWERLEDIDGGSSWFVDSDLHRAVPIGGDIAGQTAEGALRQLEVEAGVDPLDHALAKQIQAEEDAHAHEVYARRRQALEERQQRAAAEKDKERGRKEAGKPGRLGKKVKECIVM